MSRGLMVVASFLLLRWQGNPLALDQGNPIPSAAGRRDVSRSCRLAAAAWVALALVGLGLQNLLDRQLPAPVEESSAHAAAATLVTLALTGVVWFVLRCRAVAAGIGPRVGWWDDAVIVAVALAWNAALLGHSVVLPA